MSGPLGSAPSGGNKNSSLVQIDQIERAHAPYVKSGSDFRVGPDPMRKAIGSNRRVLDRKSPFPDFSGRAGNSPAPDPVENVFIIVAGEDHLLQLPGRNADKVQKAPVKKRRRLHQVGHISGRETSVRMKANLVDEPGKNRKSPQYLPRRTKRLSNPVSAFVLRRHYRLPKKGFASFQSCPRTFEYSVGDVCQSTGVFPSFIPVLETDQVQER